MKAKDKRMQEVCIQASRDLKNYPGVLAVSMDKDSLIITVVRGTKGKPILEMVAKYKLVIRFEEADSLIGFVKTIPQGI